jgi:vacuolar protein sorting-associated protein 1
MAVVSERMSAKKNPPPIMDTLQGKNANDKPKPPPPTLQQAAALNRDPNQDLIDQSNQGFFGSFFKQKPSTPGQLSQVDSSNPATLYLACVW